MSLCWSTNLERSLIIIITVLSIILTVCTIAILFTTNRHHHQHTYPETTNFNNETTSSSLTAGKNNSKVKLQQTCLTNECLQASSKILKYMDNTVNPCDDFYQFACGGFEKTTILPDNAALITIIELSDYNMEEELGELLLQPSNNLKEPRYVKLLKKYYRTCNDKNAVESYSIATMISILKDLGGWPVLEGEKWDENNFDWVTTVYKSKDLGLPFEQFLSVDVEEFDDEKKIILLRPPTHMGVLSKALNNPITAHEIYENYLGFMLDVVETFGADRDKVKQELQECLQLEVDMYYIIRTTNTKYRILLSINKLIETFPSRLPWLEYLNKILAPDANITRETFVFYDDPGFLMQLDELLNKTSKRVQANYFMWRIFIFTNKYLNEESALSHIRFGQIYGERKEFKSRWRECVADIIANFRVASTALYATNFVKKGIRENIRRTFNDIKSGMVNSTNNVDWIDGNMRFGILLKILGAEMVVGFPDEILDDVKVDEYYADLKFTENNYLKLYNNITRFNTRTEFKFLNSGFQVNNSWVDKIPEPYSNFADINGLNSMHVATLRPGDFFNSGYPNYLNFGSLGSAILQRLISFDYDSEEYNNRSQCFSEQYKKYIILTPFLLAFHVSEQCAINEAYLSYVSWMKSHEPEDLLPGLGNYTTEEFFWISLGNRMCAKTRATYEKNYDILNERLTNKERLNNAVINSKYFGNVFHCPVGSAMNLNEKCEMY